MNWHVQELRRQNKVERVSAYHFMCALNTTLLRGFGITLSGFNIPDGVIIRRLLQHETRFRDPHSGTMKVYDSEKLTASEACLL